jgi:hypothetical protein
VQNSEDTSKGLCFETRADIRIIGGLLFMWDVVLSFQNIVLVAISQKKPDFGTPKWKRTFCGTEQKTAFMVLLVVPRATRVSGIELLANYAMINTMT